MHASSIKDRRMDQIQREPLEIAHKMCKMLTPLPVRQSPAGIAARYPALIAVLPVNSAWTGCLPPA